MTQLTDKDVNDMNEILGEILELLDDMTPPQGMSILTTVAMIYAKKVGLLKPDASDFEGFMTAMRNSMEPLAARMKARRA